MPEAERTVLWLRHTAINFLFVLILCSVSSSGAEVPFPILACFASSLGRGMLYALSVVQQGSCDHPVLCSHLTPWSKILLPSQMVSLARRVFVWEREVSPAETHAAWEASIACVVTAVTLLVTVVGWDSMQDPGAMENRSRFLRAGGKGRIEGVSLLQVKEQLECMESFYGTDDRQVGSLWVMTCHKWVKGASGWEFLTDHLIVRRKQNQVFRTFEEVSAS